MRSDGGTLLALDVGERRIGVAIADGPVHFPRPLATVEGGETALQSVADLVREQAAQAVVIGLPRGLEGQETMQTRRVQTFGDELEKLLEVPVYWQDEALTSVKAEEELATRGKPYAKGDVDALAATYILEDYLHEHAEVRV